ncbi:hypothetical protein PMAYCL1PPCAC_22985 [Pristionchus mayeri]|uniref:Lipase n=1 Tax=Pristionchus mayeri TaxID=1317129 RepID=A0AAN5CYH8_9BILA|nr:hypothetical protein PMAYCL1PPCAC_22985 [Pristionchus mayeri]
MYFSSLPSKTTAVTILFLGVITLTRAHDASYFIPSSNPNPKFGSWSTVRGPITDHFEQWLNENGYTSDDFAQRFFFEFGSYGGRRNESHQVTRTPIIFYHGNEDGALAVPGNYTSGSSSQIEYFLGAGYSSAELYVTTWGTRDSNLSMTNDHSCSMMQLLRRFTLAVMEYTQSRWVNLISHSMGVTIARKIVKGGRIEDDRGGSCDLGEPLTYRVGAFIGITGANYGMCACQGLSEVDETCSATNGFWPGDSCGSNEFKCFSSHLQLPCKQENYSRLLWEMNHDGISEGQRVYSLWTVDDDLILNRAIAWGRPTSFIPGSEAFVFQNLTHMQTKENTTAQQHELLRPFEVYERLTPIPVEMKMGSSSNLLLGFLILLLIVTLILSARSCYGKVMRFNYEQIL